jgi:hypothetical protein
MSFNIEVEGGSSVRLPTAGKYCDRDIVITALGGGGGESEAVELLYETTFSVAESIPTNTKTTLATIQTGLTKNEFSNGTLGIVVIECTNDTETDMSFSHFRERIQTIAGIDGDYVTAAAQGGIVYFYRADTNTEYTGNGVNSGVLVSRANRYAAELTVQAVGNENSGGYAVAGDYSLKLYKVDIGFFGLEGLNNA